MNYPLPGSLSSLLLMGAILFIAHPAPGAENPPPDDPASVLKIACVGDSITYGAGLDGRETNCFPSVLGRELGPAVAVGNFGVISATLLRRGDLPYWDQPEFAAATDFAPDLVLILLGTNDARPLNWRYADSFAQDLRDLIEHFRATPNGPEIWLCLPPPMPGLLRMVPDHNLAGGVLPLIRQVAAEKNLPVIDLYAALQPHPDYLPDNVHPDARGARVIAATIRQALAHSPRLNGKKEVQ